ncbi:hypothetical protein DVA86_05295 [Streptomyces armeniacus]|uniref:SalK n=1 Tax=Streptomyces armeniacus TaxID=83291 RepID=A0A345XKJ0_9ACTN|nr:hypothetical protein [Streptomyces armeniacus]AXK32156.1 hypothetical protein DVA86_05295 [Streptomyces armeniacus]
MTDFPSLARSTWHQLEPVHASVYFSPEATEEAAALGYPADSRWPRYFALRSAPLGAAGPELVTAAYYSFSPRAVRAYVPGVWDTASPDAVLDARLRAVDRTLRALLGPGVDDPGIAEAARLARTAAEAADLPGRTLAAANRDLPWPGPETPHLQLWHAATVLREHRGDGHLVALRAAGLDGCESLVSFAAIGAAPEPNFATRGWTDEEWGAARERLTARGWLDAEGRATALGRQRRDDIERMTDELAAEPYRALGADGCARLAELNGPVFAAVIGAGMLPTQSTLGILTVRAPTR